MKLMYCNHCKDWEEVIGGNSGYDEYLMQCKNCGSMDVLTESEYYTPSRAFKKGEKYNKNVDLNGFITHVLTEKDIKDILLEYIAFDMDILDLELDIKTYLDM